MRPYLRKVHEIIRFNLKPFHAELPQRFSPLEANRSGAITQQKAQEALHTCREAELFLEECLHDPAFTDNPTFGDFTQEIWWQNALIEASPILDATRKEIASVRAFFSNQQVADGSSARAAASMTPTLTQTQHSEAWNIGTPGNLFKKGRPAHTLWERFKGDKDKNVALPLDDVRDLLKNYWSRKNEYKRIPKSTADVWALYVNKGLASEKVDLSE